MKEINICGWNPKEKKNGIRTKYVFEESMAENFENW